MSLAPVALTFAELPLAEFAAGPVAAALMSLAPMALTFAPVIPDATLTPVDPLILPLGPVISTPPVESCGTKVLSSSSVRFSACFSSR